MNRSYKLTTEGKRIAKTPTQSRSELLDFLYDKGDRGATYEELTLVIGKSEVRKVLKGKMKRGLVEEVGSGTF